MPTFRPGDYHRLMIDQTDGPDIEMRFGFVDFEEAAIHFVVEGVDNVDIVIDRDALVSAVIHGWDGLFQDVHADNVPTVKTDEDGDTEVVDG
tara:strand:- start:431 stop:706 length:276 start_codon:yes stop_codon:yes gene_type:complete